MVAFFTASWVRSTRLSTTTLAVSLAIGLGCFLGFFPHLALAQTEAPSASYVSQTDEDLTIRKVAVFPVRDNLDGIYARPIESHLIQLVKGYHQWDLVDSQPTETYSTIGDLEENPSQVQKISSGIEADAFLVAAASRGPTGLTIRLNLFMKKDGKLLAQEILKDYPRFEIADLKNQMATLFQKLVKKIPYNGMILSRQGNRVTVNLGRTDGITQNQTLTVVQIVKVNRHPKFNFIVGAEKEILGKIKILKAEDTLSFGTVVTELEKGLLRRFHKIAGLDPVTYSEPDSLESPSSGGGGLSDRDDAKTSFGNNPGEWLPARQPSFGSAGIRVGFGSFTTAVTLPSESVEGSSSLYPSIGLHGELWLNDHWAVRAELEQGIISMSNPLAGSTPSKLDLSVTRYQMVFGYNFLLQDEFFGPKIQLRGGFSQYKLSGPDTNPTAFTNTTYSGMVIGVSGSLPISDKKDWYMGAGTDLYLMPKMKESPVVSGADSSSTVNNFNVYAEKKLSENLHAVGALDVSLYSSNFTGDGSRRGTDTTASSQSQRHTVFSGGINYFF